MDQKELYMISNYYKIMICDNVDHNKANELKHVYNFVKPDVLLSDIPNTFVPSYDFTHTTSINIGELTIHTDETIANSNAQNSIIISSKNIEELKQYNPLLVCQLGMKYISTPHNTKQWFGKQHNIPWVMCGQLNEYLSFVILQINKQTLTIDDGLHSFEWLFWNEKTLRNKPDTIFTIK